MKVLLTRYLLNCSLFIFLFAMLIHGRETDRFIDVRKIIKGALDVMRTYPAPNTLIQLLPQQHLDTGAAFLQPTMVTPLSVTSLQDYRNIMNYQGNMTVSTNNLEYNNNYYEQSKHLAPQYSLVTPSLRRIFAQPTKMDMEKLFHLPADIIQRLATDAGYINNEKQPSLETESFKKGDQEGESSANNFNFNINQGPTKLWGMDSKKEQEITTTTKGPAIVASDKPKILMRSVNRDGKIIQIPVIVIPQPNGEKAYIPFERLSDLSDALSKLVSTGQISMDDIFAFSSIPFKHSEEKVQKSKLVSSGLSSNPLIDQTSDAIATNKVPTQTMRKIFPVKDVVYPTSSLQTAPQGSTIKEHIMVGLPTTTSITDAMSMNIPVTTAEKTEGIASTQQPNKLEEKKKKIVISESKAFVQEMDAAEDSQEKSKEKKNEKKSASSEDAKTLAAENMLNAKTYKLVEAAEGSTTKASINEMNTISNLTNRILKSQPTQVPANGHPISLASDENIKQQEWSMANDQMVPFNTTTTPVPFHVSQKQEYPALSQQNEFKFQNLPSPVSQGINLVRKGIKSVKIGDETVKYGMNAVRHGMDLAGNQPMIQHFYTKDALVQQKETVDAAAAAAQQLPRIYPVYPVSDGQLESFNNARSKKILPRLEEQAFLVNNGAFRPIPLRGIQSIRKGFTGDTRQKEKNYREVYQFPSQMAFHKQYSLKELEAFYNNQKGKLNENFKTTEMSVHRVYPPLKELKIGQQKIAPSDSFNEGKMSRLEKLRRQFAQERASVAKRTKNIFLHRANAYKQETIDAKVTENHCQNLRSFSRQFGTLDVEFFAKKNCRFIETYYPDLKCSKLNEYLADCKNYL